MKSLSRHTIRMASHRPAPPVLFSVHVEIVWIDFRTSDILLVFLTNISCAPTVIEVI